MSIFSLGYVTEITLAGLNNHSSFYNVKNATLSSTRWKGCGPLILLKQQIKAELSLEEQENPIRHKCMQAREDTHSVTGTLILFVALYLMTSVPQSTELSLCTSDFKKRNA